jgi:hypothetical protein
MNLQSKTCLKILCILRKTQYKSNLQEELRKSSQYRLVCLGAGGRKVFKECRLLQQFRDALYLETME